MNQSERRLFLINYLLDEKGEEGVTKGSASEDEEKFLLRSLLNLRMPGEASDEFMSVQDDYLQEETRLRGVVDYKALTPVEEGIYLWQGDITNLNTDAIVNAANSQMMGCFHPNHKCIDNCIHTFAGIQLRKACYDIIAKQGREEATGRAKITPAFNLPSKYVIHTVGPIVQESLNGIQERLLASCYTSCLKLAEENNCKSIAFCCISTGVYMFPNDRAAEIAVETVRKYKEKNNSTIDVVFNVFKDLDKEIYQRLLGCQ